MSNIAEKLRNIAIAYKDELGTIAARYLHNAADEIDQLRAQPDEKARKLERTQVSKDDNWVWWYESGEHVNATAWSLRSHEPPDVVSAKPPSFLKDR